MSLPYQAYLFDLYGTLAEIWTDEGSARLWEKTALYYSENGAPYGADELRAAYARLCGAEIARHSDPLYEIELRKVFRALYTEKGVRPDRRRVEDTAVFFRLESLEKLRLYPWVRPVFAALRENGAALYLLSNAQSCFTVPELRVLGLADAFDGIYISSDARVKKPSPLFIRKLLEERGLSPERCLMVGNDQRADVGVAHAVGMDALYLQTETSGDYDPARRAEYELLDGDFSRLPALMGLV
ncbi:MAG: HAD family hydrolase [Oscillospiraceae bacterium]|nr:HAD family hydrolase [Oscillospiraceae bacterium]